MQKITNGLGTQTKISYEPMTNNTIYTRGTINIDKIKNIQNSMHVVDTICFDDGLGGWFTQVFLYEGAAYHLEGKGFLGFSDTHQKDLSTGLSVSKTSYLHPDYFVPYVFYIHNFSNLPPQMLSEEQIKYEIHDFGNKRIFIYNNFDQINIFRTGDETLDYVRTIRKLHHYNTEDINYGNISSDKILVDEEDIHFAGANSNFDYYTINNYDYNYNDIDDWLISRPEQHTVTKKSPDDETEHYQQYNYAYYGSEYPQYPLLKTISLVPNNFETFQVNTALEYDNYGNVIKETISAPNYTLSPIEDRITAFEYSSEYNYRFLTRKTKSVNNIDFIETNQYCPTTGLPKSTTDINGQTTSWFYDGFGRMVKKVQPNGVQTQNVLRWNIFPDIEHAVYYQWQKTSGTPAVFVSLDKLNRDHKTWTNSFDDRTIIKDKFYYEQNNAAHGKLYRETEPYFPGDDPLINEYLYLPTGQLKWLIGSATSTKFTYDGRTTITENITTNQYQSQTLNAVGQLSHVEDPCGTVEYLYNSSGQPSLIEKNTGGLQSVIEILYDDAGFKDQLNDPDAGNFSFDFNPYGELIEQTNARGFTYKMLYDALGRMTEKKLLNPLQTTTYDYDGDNALGLISSLSGHNGISQHYYYNQDAQLIRKTETIEGQVYEFKYDYDVLGRLKQETWPTGFAVNYKYRNGYLGKVVDKLSNKVLWELNSTNARNQVLQYALGNNLITSNEYDDFGFPKSITTSNAIQNLSYDFDQETGNLNWRKDETDPAKVREEVFGYDDDRLKSRLTSWIVSNGEANTIDYLDNGNIDLKSDVGDYTYDVPGQTGGPHALKKIESPVAAYLQHAPPQHVSYTPFDKVSAISHPQSSRRLTFTYGPGNARKITHLYRTNDTDDNTLLKSKYFIGGNYEIEVDAQGHQRKLHYLSASTGLFAIFVQENESENMCYIHKDYLGSFQAITNEEGELVEKYSFDPWGRRRNADDWTFNNVPPSFTFDRGYTGHEHLDEFVLINMLSEAKSRSVAFAGNGRVYDPFVARFLSPDPFVQNANSTQGFNRYSYVSNNPLKFTDPSGYSYKPIYWKKSNPATILVPFGPGFIGTGLVNFSNHGSSYYYNHNTNTYYNAANGQPVNYQEVRTNYIEHNAYATITGPSAGSIFNDWSNGMNIYEVQAFGNTTLVGAFGELGIARIGINGGIGFYNPTAGAYLSGGEKVAANQVGINWINIAIDHTRKMIEGASLIFGGVKIVAKEYVRQVAINNKLAGIVDSTLPNTYNTAKGMGKKLGVVGGVIVVADVAYNSQVNTSDLISATMTGIAFTGWGAPIAGLWFVTDFGTDLITGTSISDRIDSSVGAPILDWDY